MFGNLVTNRQLRTLIASQDIRIEPFDDQNLKSTHYTLQAGRILKHDSEGNLRPVHVFERDGNSPIYELKKDDYVVIEPAQSIQLNNKGIVGRFIAPSTLIESGLSLVAGQISNGYGQRGERVRFGIKNLTDNSFFLDQTFRVARVEFFDLRGITMDAVTMTREETRAWALRLVKAIDDGPDYGADD